MGELFLEIRKQSFDHPERRRTVIEAGLANRPIPRLGQIDRNGAPVTSGARTEPIENLLFREEHFGQVDLEQT